MKEISLNVTADQWAQLHEQCGNSDEPIKKAIGYLILWNWSTHPFVNISIMGGFNEMEILAVCRKEKDGPISYTIGAVWHNDHFGFHS